MPTSDPRGEHPSFAFLDDRRIGVLLGDSGNFRIMTLDADQILRIVRESLTRGFTDAECERFGFEECPTLEELRGDGPPG